MIWPDFSIIVVTKNRYYQLFDAVNCICNNTIKPKNIIIVDGSIKRNKNIISLIKLGCSKVKINFRYIFSAKNLATCRNIGLAKVTTKFFGFIDDDQYIPKNWVKVVKKIFTSNPKIDVLVGPLASRYKDNYWNIVWQDVNKYQLKIKGKVNFAPGANTCYKTFFLKKNHINFDKRFLWAAEDWGISYKLLNNKAYIYQTPKLTVIHDCRTTFLGFIKQWFKYGIGINQYHRFYLLDENKKFIRKILSIFELLLSSYPICPNSKRLSLYPGYIILNLSYLIGYLKANIIKK